MKKRGRKKKEEQGTQKPQETQAAEQEQKEQEATTATENPGAETKAEDTKTEGKKAKKAKKDKGEKNKVKKVTRTLPCKYTAEEYHEATDELLSLIEQKDQLEGSKSDIVKSYGAKIKGIEEKIIEKTGLLRAEIIDRVVECEWRFNDPKKGLKSLYRMDTNVAIETQDMDLLDGSGNVPPQCESSHSTDDKDHATSGEREVELKNGDNGVVFHWPSGRTAPIVNFKEVEEELTSEVIKNNIVANFTEQDLIDTDTKLPEGIYRIIRGKNSKKETIYLIQKLMSDWMRKIPKEESPATSEQTGTTEEVPAEPQTNEEDCGECGATVEISADKISPCPECGKPVFPCNACMIDRDKCNHDGMSCAKFPNGMEEEKTA